MTEKADASVERLLLEEVTTRLPNAILEKFSTLICESTSEDEKGDAEFLVDYLKE